MQTESERERVCRKNLVSSDSMECIGVEERQETVKEENEKEKIDKNTLEPNGKICRFIINAQSIFCMEPTMKWRRRWRRRWWCWPPHIPWFDYVQIFLRIFKSWGHVRGVLYAYSISLIKFFDTRALGRLCVPSRRWQRAFGAAEASVCFACNCCVGRLHLSCSQNATYKTNTHTQTDRGD